MYTLFGVLFHILGGVASGSFYMPFKKVKNWKWESYWLAGGFFSWIIAPLTALYLTFPEFGEILFLNKSAVYLCVFFGILWGIGGLTYGLGMRYLGISLGNSVILGFSSAFGALIPALYYDLYPKEGKISLTFMLSNTGGRIVILGIILCLLAIIISGRAGILKERDQQSDKISLDKGEFNLKKGLLVGIISGILSACFNYGIEAGKPLAELAVAKGVNPLFQNNIIFLVVLWGGFATNFIWCSYLNIKNKSFKDYTDKNTPLIRNYIFCAAAGITWFLQFFFYGMGESRLGNGASSWILHMSAIILVGNLWGLALKEWKNVSKTTFKTMILGLALLLVSVIVVGYGNSLM